MTTPTTTSKLDLIRLELMETYASQFAKASELGTKGDVAGMSKAIMDIQAQITTKANERLDKDKKDLEAKVTSELAGKTALELHAQDVFQPVFDVIKPGFEKLSTVGQVIFRLEKNSDGNASFTVLVGNLTKIASDNGSGRNGPRNHSITVNDKLYETVALAWKGTMPGVDQPSVTIGKGAEAKQSKTRGVAVEAMEKAGHKVN